IFAGGTGSHYYTINRYEAAKKGIDIKDPTQAQYETIEAVYMDISDELSLNQPHFITLDPEVEIVKQGLIESVAGGSDCFCSKFVRQAVNRPGESLNVQQMTSSAGWKRG
ncbi:MAG: hypothetical protein LUD72_01645, partial [Bacteroidales bacterium]|nr:hypothetical protein [Bacteroidales bacterium]